MGKKMTHGVVSDRIQGFSLQVDHEHGSGIGKMLLYQMYLHLLLMYLMTR